MERPSIDEADRPPELLYRFGLEQESAERLAVLAAEAEAAGFPHGISVFSRSSRPDAVSAPFAEVAARFRVHKTGRNPYHYTVELPKPVTEDVAAVLNQVLARPSAT
jgi:hypothetical protein